MSLKSFVMSRKKSLLLFGSAFLICPCPIHGTLLGLGLVGGHAFVSKMKKHECEECEPEYKENK